MAARGESHARLVEVGLRHLIVERLPIRYGISRLQVLITPSASFASSLVNSVWHCGRCTQTAEPEGAREIATEIRERTRARGWQSGEKVALV